MHLGKRYEPERTLAACQRMLQIGSTSYRSVNAILKNGLDKVPLPLEPPDARSPETHQLHVAAAIP